MKCSMFDIFVFSFSFRFWDDIFIQLVLSITFLITHIKCETECNIIANCVSKDCQEKHSNTSIFNSEYSSFAVLYYKFASRCGEYWVFLYSNLKCLSKEWKEFWRENGRKYESIIGSEMKWIDSLKSASTVLLSTCHEIFISPNSSTMLLYQSMHHTLPEFSTRWSIC